MNSPLPLSRTPRERAGYDARSDGAKAFAFVKRVRLGLSTDDLCFCKAIKPQTYSTDLHGLNERLP